jgi:hypothetical protein
MLMLCRTDAAAAGERKRREVIFGIQERAFEGVAFFGLEFRRRKMVECEHTSFVRTVERVFLLLKLPLYHGKNQSFAWRHPVQISSRSHNEL